MTREPRVSQSGRHLVRPRLVWGGTGTAVLGMLAVGVGMILGSDMLTWVGAAVLVAGLLTSWRGGVLNDVSTGAPLDQSVEDVRNDIVHEGVSSEAVVVAGTTQRTAAEVTVRKRELLEERVAAPFPSWSPVGILGLLMLALWLLVGQWVLAYPFSVTGQNAALRDLGFAIVIALSALWLRQVGANRFASGLCLLSGFLLVVAGALFPHDAGRVQWNEIISGALVVVSAVIVLSARSASR